MCQMHHSMIPYPLAVFPHLMLFHSHWPLNLPTILPYLHLPHLLFSASQCWTQEPTYCREYILSAYITKLKHYIPCSYWTFIYFLWGRSSTSLIVFFSPSHAFAPSSITPLWDCCICPVFFQCVSTTQSSSLRIRKLQILTGINMWHYD